MNIKKLIVEAIKNKLDENYDSPNMGRWSNDDIRKATAQVKNSSLPHELKGGAANTNLNPTDTKGETHMGETIQERCYKIFKERITDYIDIVAEWKTFVKLRGYNLYIAFDRPLKTHEIEAEASLTLDINLNTGEGQLEFSVLITSNETQWDETPEGLKAFEAFENVRERMGISTDRLNRVLGEMNAHIHNSIDYLNHKLNTNLLSENYDSPDTPKWLKTQISRAADFKKKDAPMDVPLDNIDQGGSVNKIISVEDYRNLIIPRLNKLLPYLGEFKISDPEEQDNPNFFSTIFQKMFNTTSGIKGYLLIQVQHDVKNKKGMFISYFYVPQGSGDDEASKQREVGNLLKKYTNSFDFTNGSFLQGALKMDTNIKAANRELKSLNLGQVI
jgi:hypothetical protein